MDRIQSRILACVLYHALLATSGLHCSSGGDIAGGRTGFLGCMRNLFVQGSLIADIPVGANTGGVINGSCSLEDRCVLSLQCLDTSSADKQRD